MTLIESNNSRKRQKKQSQLLFKLVKQWYLCALVTNALLTTAHHELCFTNAHKTIV